MSKIITVTTKTENPNGGQIVLSTTTFPNGDRWRHGAIVLKNIKIFMEFDDNNSMYNFEIWDKNTNRQLF